VLFLVEDMVHHGRYYHTTFRVELTIRRCYNVNHSIFSVDFLADRFRRAYLKQLSEQTPQLDSPLPSSSSAASIDAVSSPPSEKQVLTAYLLTMLLAAPPHYAMQLTEVKEGLTLKAKTSGILGQGTTRILFGCVSKRLLKIDRGGKQVVKFDI